MADTVGLLRGGSLLAEGNPEALIQQHGYGTLEDTFLALCRLHKPAVSVKDMGGDNDSGQTADNDELLQKRPASIMSTASSVVSAPNLERLSINRELMAENAHLLRNAVHRPADIRAESCYIRPRPRVLLAMFIRKMSSLLKDWRMLIFVLAMPALQIVLFGIAIGGNPIGLNLAVVNKDVGVDYGFFSFNIGDVLVNELQTNYSVALNVLNYTTVESAKDAVLNGNAWGVVAIPQNFTTSLIDRFLNCSEILDPVLAREGTVRVWLDESNAQIAQYLILQIEEAFEAVVTSYVGPVQLPVDVQAPLYGETTPRFIVFLAPGIMTVICYAYSTFLTAISFVNERSDGTLDRVFAAGVSPSEVVLGHKLTFAVVLVVQVFSMILVTIFGFGIPCEGPMEIIFFLGLILGLAGMSFGLLISSQAEREFDAMQMVWGSFFPVLLLSGILWPVQAIPRWMQYVSLAFPTTWAADAFRSVMTRGWGITYYTVWMGFVVSGAWLAFFLVGAVLSLRTRS
eukprot:TRINITY_DN901_c0_g1_i1.p1 TRINITY_DN901_c0_g1~~TRINITY_DN901_c0_g1_i1.p1  ORF type:complete len:513 (+),score=119.78 TRINITY_DN901_c0_g1_i1:805-2343(+)